LPVFRAWSRDAQAQPRRADPPACTTPAAGRRADTPEEVAIAYCLGTPLRNEIEVRGTPDLMEATALAAAVIGREFDTRLVHGTIQAHVIAVGR
jgi:hypothetical protein